MNNEKIEYDSVNNMFSYKPTYQIKSKEDLSSLLISKRKEGGMDYKDLKDSYSKLSSAVEELAGEGVILVVRNKDGNPRVLFYNDAQYNTPIDAGKREALVEHFFKYLSFNRLQKDVVRNINSR